MNPEIVYYAIGGVCSLIVAVLGLRRVGRSAGSVTENVDPNQAIADSMDDYRRRLSKVERDHQHALRRLATVEQDLRDERHRSDQQDQHIARLQSENQTFRSLQGFLAEHIVELRRGIEDGSIPPLPPTPAEILAIIRMWSPDLTGGAAPPAVD